MQHKVDYFSYSKNLWGKRETPGRLLPQVYAPITIQQIPDYMPAFEDGWKVIANRPGTVFGINYDKHCNVWLGFDGMVTIEHTGMGCLYLEDRGLLYKVISDHAEQCTRLDLATDILTDADPLAFVEMRTNKRSKSHEDKKSNSGRTYVIGSKSSERHTKVYRYTDPHPRHMFLRIEYTYHREDAKNIARMLDEYSLPGLCIASGKRYGWTHPDYQPDLNATEYEIKAWRPERRGGKTALWLYKQVLPAIVKSVENGEIDMEEFISDIRLAVVAAERRGRNDTVHDHRH